MEWRRPWPYPFLSLCLTLHFLVSFRVERLFKCLRKMPAMEKAGITSPEILATLLHTHGFTVEASTNAEVTVPSEAAPDTELLAFVRLQLAHHYQQGMG